VLTTGKLTSQAAGCVGAKRLSVRFRKYHFGRTICGSLFHVARDKGNGFIESKGAWFLFLNDMKLRGRELRRALVVVVKSMFPTTRIGWLCSLGSMPVADCRSQRQRSACHLSFATRDRETLRTAPGQMFLYQYYSGVSLERHLS
jgi:hypothetical protein